MQLWKIALFYISFTLSLCKFLGHLNFFFFSLCESSSFSKVTNFAKIWIPSFTIFFYLLRLLYLEYLSFTRQEQSDANRMNQPAETDNNQSTTNLLATNALGLERDPSSTSLGNDDLTFRDYTIVKDTLYSSRENINMVNEIFRQVTILIYLVWYA